MPEHVHGRALSHPVEPNRAWSILESHEKCGCLCDRAMMEFNRLRAITENDLVRTARWAPGFLEACEEGTGLYPLSSDPLTLVDRGHRRFNTRMVALEAVWKARARGVTGAEVIRAGGRAGGVSGSLSILHQAGVIARLDAKR
jgi:hypothetical protein